MKTTMFLAALAVAASAAAQDAPKIDNEALAPILKQSWALGATCDAPEGVLDWALDNDGWVYRRDGGFTPLDVAKFKNGTLTTHDSVGIGLTIVTYQIRADGALRLMSETWYEEGDTNGMPTIVTKDGRSVAAEGSAETPQDTPALVACPQRMSVYPAEPVAALNGKWAALEGGSCAKGTGAIHFDLERPVPRISRGPMGEMAEGEAMVLSIARDGDAWAVAEGGAMEASVYRFTLARDGTLTQVSEYEGAVPIRFQRCM